MGRGRTHCSAKGEGISLRGVNPRNGLAYAEAKVTTLIVRDQIPNDSLDTVELGCLQY